MEAVLSKEIEPIAIDYKISTMWNVRLSDLSHDHGSLSGIFPSDSNSGTDENSHHDINTNMKSSLNGRNGDSCNSSNDSGHHICLPITSLSILPNSSYTEMSLVVLDSSGAAWRVDRGCIDSISYGPFRELSNFSADMMFSSDGIVHTNDSNNDGTNNNDNDNNNSDNNINNNTNNNNSNVNRNDNNNNNNNNISSNSNNSSNNNTLNGNSQKSTDRTQRNDVKGSSRVMSSIPETCVLLHGGNVGNKNLNGSYLYIPSGNHDSLSQQFGSLLVPLSGIHNVPSTPSVSGPGQGPGSGQGTGSGLGSGPVSVTAKLEVIKGTFFTMSRSAPSLPLMASCSAINASREMLVSVGCGVLVRGASLGYHTFLGLLDILSGRNERNTRSTEGTQSTASANENAASASFLLRRMMVSLQHPLQSPSALQLFVESLELYIKRLLESSTFYSASKCNRWIRLNSPVRPVLTPTQTPFHSTSSSSSSSSSSHSPSVIPFVTGWCRYSEIMSVLYLCSPPCLSIFTELVSRLGRKLEPSLSRRLFPIPIDFKILSSIKPDISIASHDIKSNIPSSQMSEFKVQGPLEVTPLNVFEHALSTKQLNRSCRMLTLACEDVGGTDSPLSSSLCLQMSLELLYECLRHLSIPLAVQCFDFCNRLEAMVCKK